MKKAIINTLKETRMNTFIAENKDGTIFATVSKIQENDNYNYKICPCAGNSSGKVFHAMTEQHMNDICATIALSL